MIDCKRCGTRHEGWETVVCNKAKQARQSVTVTPGHDKTTVTVTTKPAKSVTVTPELVTVTSRMTELRRRKAAQGLIALTVWAHPDNHAKIKDFAKSLDKP